jgi:hypothetical protein
LSVLISASPLIVGVGSLWTLAAFAFALVYPCASPAARNAALASWYRQRHRSAHVSARAAPI